MTDAAPELYRKYRPVNFGDVIGQPDAVAQLIDMGRNQRIPHCILFTGPSGCGKTTLARILANKMKCSSADYEEINASDENGVAMVRRVLETVELAAMGGPVKVYLIDECQRLSDAAQHTLLKVLEEPPNHVFFFLATTDPENLKKPILTRSTVIQCKSISDTDLTALINKVAQAEGITLQDAVVRRMVEASDGSARKALVILHAVRGIPEAEAQMRIVEASDATKFSSFELVKAVCNGASWSKIFPILESLHKEKADAENIRLSILGYARTMMMNDPPPARAVNVIEIFSERNFWDIKHAGLARACYRAVK